MPHKPTRPLRRTRLLGEGMLYWSPVWVPLLILGQIAFRGLRPALVERERLLGEEPGVVDRHDHALQRWQSMNREVEAWADPMYSERMRRVMAVERSTPVANAVANSVENR